LINDFCCGLLQGLILTLCESMIVLYLYDNCLTKVPTLPSSTPLSALYLQNNCIHRMAGLTPLKHLSRLWAYRISHVSVSCCFTCASAFLKSVQKSLFYGFYGFQNKIWTNSVSIQHYNNCYAECHWHTQLLHSLTLFNKQSSW